MRNNHVTTRLTHTWVRRHLFLTAFLLCVIFSLSLWAFDTWLAPTTHHIRFGVSFSEDRAKAFGVDWQANYTALLTKLPLYRVRLMSYWNDNAPTPTSFNFSDLDWQVSQAQSHHLKISLALGLRQPGWPECHEPQWATSLSDSARETTLLDYIQAVVNRYKHTPALEGWQLENEALNSWFGNCPHITETDLKQEFTLIKKLDPTHPITMSLSDEHGLPIRGPIPDAYGMSVYRVVYTTLGPWHFYIPYPAPLWWHKLRIGLIQFLHHRPVIIHELQMEPWGPQATQNLGIAEQNKSMSITQIHKNFSFAKRLGVTSIDLWGGEWWYWRAVHFHDPSIWNAVKEELTQEVR